MKKEIYLTKQEQADLIQAAQDEGYNDISIDNYPHLKLDVIFMYNKDTQHAIGFYNSYLTHTTTFIQ